MPARRISRAPPKPDDMSDAEWETYLFVRTNARGRHFERWRHIHGCGRFFNAVRDTDDRPHSERTYKTGEARPETPAMEAL